MECQQPWRARYTSLRSCRTYGVGTVGDVFQGDYIRLWKSVHATGFLNDEQFDRGWRRCALRPSGARIEINMVEKRDYYEVLEISRTATGVEIKSAYRKMARKFHPDINKDDHAEERFKEVNE